MVVLKLLFGKEIRKLGKAPEVLNEVKTKVNELFKLNDSFLVHSTDGLEVRIDDQNGYEAALNASERLMRLKVIERKASSDKETQVNLEEIICSEYKKVELINKETEVCDDLLGGDVDLGVRCYQCKREVYDMVYWCDRCEYFYVCEDCRRRISHSHELFKSNRRVVISSSVHVTSSLIKRVKEMGFSNERDIIEALSMAKGDISGTITILIDKSY